MPMMLKGNNLVANRLSLYQLLAPLSYYISHKPFYENEKCFIKVA